MTGECKNCRYGCPPLVKWYFGYGESCFSFAPKQQNLDSRFPLTDVNKEELKGVYDE